MPRLFVLLAVSLALPLACRAAEPAEPTETVVRMTVQPMAAPKPALKYQLLPEMSEMNPGNPVQGYMLCFAEEYNFFHLQEFVEQREKWLKAPLKDFPVDKVLRNVERKSRDIDFAARLDTPDWQVLLRLKRDGVNTLLPDVQQMRSLAEVLKLRFRAQVAGRRFDEAIAGAKTMFAISRHLGEHPAGVAALVGYAVAELALDPLEEMIQQPGCPNLYWAITTLPSPLIDLHKADSEERGMFAPDFELFDETTPMTEAHVKSAIQQFTARLTKWHPNSREETEEFTGRLKALIENEVAVDAARKRLVESGLSAETAKRFPPDQVVLLDEKHKHERLLDEVLKLTFLPYWQIEGELAASEKRATDNAGSLFASMGVRNLRTRQIWHEQRIALLRCVEALRLYAAEHDGKFPAALDDVPVPAPIDPVTGKSFSYKLDGATAILHGTPPRGKEKDAVFNRRYEVTIQK